MASRDEFKRARARLLLETPISDDATLLNLEEAAADFIRESKCGDPSEPHVAISTVVDAVARGYFRHAVRNHRRIRDPATTTK